MRLFPKLGSATRAGVLVPPFSVELVPPVPSDPLPAGTIAVVLGPDDLTSYDPSKTVVLDG